MRDQILQRRHVQLPEIGQYHTHFRGRSRLRVWISACHGNLWLRQGPKYGKCLTVPAPCVQWEMSQRWWCDRRGSQVPHLRR